MAFHYLKNISLLAALAEKGGVARTSRFDKLAIKGSKQQLMPAFEQVIAERKLESKIATKQQEK